MVTYQEAKAILLDLAGEEYCSISFSETLSPHADYQPKCSLYIHGHGYTYGETWNIAIAEMRIKVFPLTQNEVVEIAPV